MVKMADIAEIGGMAKMGVKGKKSKKNGCEPSEDHAGLDHLPFQANKCYKNKTKHKNELVTRPALPLSGFLILLVLI